MRETQLDDLFGRKIVPGDSFLRIEDAVGGSNLRYYFLGGIIENGDKIQVQEYGGSPRTIKRPSPHQSTLILMTPDLLALIKLVPPPIESVVSPKPAKKSKPKKDDHVVI